MALFRCLNPATLSSINGVKVLTGELEPTSTLGTNGDIYLQTGNEGALLHFDEDFTDEGEHTWTIAAGTGEVSDEQSKFGGKSLKLTAGILKSEDDDGVFIPGKEDFTVSLWVYPTVTSRIALFATQGTGIAMDLHYNGDANLWASSTGNSWNVIQSDSASAANAGNGTITVNTNEWTHIAYVRKGGKCMSFVNGVLSKEVSISEIADLKGSGQFNLGGWDNLNQYRYTGYIDDFMYLKGAALWEDAFTPPTEPMTLPIVCKKAFRKIDNVWIEIEGTEIENLGSFENPYAANLKVLNGTAIPSNDLGNDGDIYLKAENDIVSSAYQKVNGAWQSLINSPINEKTIVEPMSVYSGSDAPTSILGKDNDLYLRNLTTPITFDDWTSQNEAGMTVTTTANNIQIIYDSGAYIGAYAYKKIDFTNIKSITFKLKSGSHSYNNYGTKRFCPFLYISDTVRYAVDTDADTPLGLISRITTDDTEITDTFDTSDIYGEKYLIFNSSGCTSTLESITFTYYLLPQIKINGSWQDLANTSIEDIFFAKSIPAGIYGYTQLSYIKSDGSSWINSNLKFITDTEFEIGGRWTTTSLTSEFFFGVWESLKESELGYENRSLVYLVGGTGKSQSFIPDTNSHIISSDTNGIYIDGVSVGTPTWSNVSTGYDIPIFARSVTGTIDGITSHFELGYCKIWQGGDLIRDFVPCKRNYDNAIGLYDKANDKFYQNNGSGEIIAGPVITG